jgi:membrane associated rhomboid family serine protease
MIPLADENFGRRSFPWVTVGLIVTCVIVFIYQLSLGSAGGDQFVYRWGVIPREIMTGTDLPPYNTLPVFVTLITSMFMHGGFAHIAVNMLFLWIFGDNIEDAMGHFRYLFFYLLTGIIAAFSQIAISPHSTVPSLGASGAIAGVMGAYIVLFPRGRVYTLILVRVVKLPAILVIGIWALLQFLTGFGSLGSTGAASGGVAYFAHIGGFVSGVLLVKLFQQRRTSNRYSW